MPRRTNNPLRRFGERCDFRIWQNGFGSTRSGHRQASCHMRCLVGLLLLAFTTPDILAQNNTPQPTLKGLNASISELLRAQQPPATAVKKSLTLADALSVFLQHNLQLVAGRYDIETADAEKLTARLRPNPEFNFDTEELPLDFSGPFFHEQEITYSISQTFEMGGKRRKRIDVANVNAELARAEFQTTMWQLTNDLKKKFYAVVLAQSLLRLAQENQQTFAEIIKHTTELKELGEISGLDLSRLEIEKFKFDTDVASSQKDYELAVRDLRLALGGDYQAMNIEVAGTLDYQPYQFSFADLRDKSLAARPDLRAAQISERAADSAIRLQDAQRIPDLNVGVGVKQVLVDKSYSVGIGIALPVFDRNQGERLKALIQKKRAQNDQKALTNQVLSDVDKALTAFEIQKKRVELYRSGVLTKVDDRSSQSFR